MLVNILVIGLVASYCAIVLLGHILLLIAFWPGLAPKRQTTARMTRPAPTEPVPLLELAKTRLAA